MFHPGRECYKPLIHAVFGVRYVFDLLDPAFFVVSVIRQLHYITGPDRIALAERNADTDTNIDPVRKGIGNPIRKRVVYFFMGNVDDDPGVSVFNFRC